MKRFEVGLSNGSVLTLERIDGKETTIDDFMKAIQDAISNDYIYLKYSDEALIKIDAITYVLELPNEEEVHDELKH
ncbi:hypothetical protein DKZ23_09695 [Limosilactobacillus reuteri]|uniref:DUF2922 domain-containing protein n=1 Tax=Limosilactobacillus reuteri TaxID=1598 RepID=A0A317GFS8_LIMRT|nr:hypothetical protein [Limosilactobacillus reuteri]MCH5384808.1 hypothetical protein [Limosilactobacillus reuteri]PWT45445.1 hypothetical protein DKZ23_09695 [Limosilactobacillus reuteri]PWT46093.1 hypothetical protein DKZ33_10900 [Limosilactobacillus reuteri]PWT57074.1 hypothetical protein DKZ32_10910 [Limosilactobacillus reuteri]